MVSCFFDKKRLITGKYSLKSNLSGNGKGRDLIEGLDGDIDFKAGKGRLFRFELLSKIMSVLSITEIYRGHVPDLFTEGCAYDTLRITGKIKDGKNTLTDSVWIPLRERGSVASGPVRKKMMGRAVRRCARRQIIGCPAGEQEFDGGIIFVP